MTTTILWRPLTFWDEAQIEAIRKREVNTLLYQNKEYKELDNKINECNNEISSLEDYIDDLNYEKQELKEEILKRNPFLNTFNINN